MDHFPRTLCETRVRVCGHKIVTPRESGFAKSPTSSHNGAAADDGGAKYGTCDHCPSRFLVEYHSLDPLHVCLVLTTWLDLGSKLRPRCIPGGCEVFVMVDDPVPDPRVRVEECSLAHRSGPSSDSPAALSLEEVRNRNFGLLGVVIPNGRDTPMVQNWQSNCDVGRRCLE